MRVKRKKKRGGGIQSFERRIAKRRILEGNNKLEREVCWRKKTEKCAVGEGEGRRGGGGAAKLIKTLLQD